MPTPTDRTRPLRLRDRMTDDDTALREVLDEALVCHVGFIVDGDPRILPTLFVREGDLVYLHGSSGSRLALLARGDGVPVCLTVTVLDGLVLARSQFHHSVNYRSVIVHGTAHLVTDDSAKLRVLAAMVDKVGTGRAAETRAPDDRELAQTAVLALALDEAATKRRAGGVVDDEADLTIPAWAGVVPIRQVRGEPQPDAGVTVPLPAYLTGQPGRTS